MRQSVSLKRHWMMRALGLALLLTVFSGVGQSQSPQPTVITIDTQTVTHSISPYIYGLNFANMTFADEIDLPVNRFGGNATSRYNWQTDTTNLGMDWYFENYPHALQGSSKNPSILPDGSSADNFLAANAANSTATLMVMPTIGWTAAFTDVRCGFSVKKYGAQQATDYQWYPDCGNGIKPNGKFITTNDPLDTSRTIDPAFVQGWVSFISGKYGAASDSNPRFYNLDNEPGLWHETHRDVYPNPISAAELVARSIQYASAIKTIDAGAKILGPVEWGYMAYFYSASDWASYMDNGTRPEYEASGLYQTPFYLQAMKNYETQHGVRILDYLDLHFYPQGQGVALSKAGSAATQALRLRQTRGLWDRNYTDESWINKPIFLIPQMREWVDAYYPGTLLAVSEYNFGGLEHINGAVTQAEVLGIFGRENLHLATLWSPPNPNQPGAFAFRMYRNYDGLGGQYGDQNHPATSTRIHRVSAYASTRSGDGTLTVMLVNKTTSAQALTVNINGDYRQARPYRYSTADLKRVVRLAPLGINNGVMNMTLPAMSITLLEIKPTPASKALLVNGGF